MLLWGFIQPSAWPWTDALKPLNSLIHGDNLNDEIPQLMLVPFGIIPVGSGSAFIGACALLRSTVPSPEWLTGGARLSSSHLWVLTTTGPESSALGYNGAQASGDKGNSDIYGLKDLEGRSPRFQVVQPQRALDSILELKVGPLELVKRGSIDAGFPRLQQRHEEGWWTSGWIDPVPHSRNSWLRLLL